jgi:hypothetical protein
VATLAAEFAVAVSFGLAGLVIATLNIGFGIVFLYPRNDMFGIEGDTIAAADPVPTQFGSDKADSVSQ